MVQSIGRYRVDSEIGTGASSTVFKAFDQDRAKEVALKLLHPEVVESLGEGALERLRAAAEVSTRLDHPLVVNVTDAGQEETFCYVCMDFVDGRSLFELVGTHGPFPLPETLRVAIDVLDGLDYTHRKGVVHGDLKLENVMLRRDGRVVVTDFGMVKPKAAEGSAGAVSLPPELILGQPMDTRSDLYAVGILLFELLTGDAAFPVEEGEDPREAARRRVESPPPSLAARLPGCPPELEAIVTKALARDPAVRFQAAADLARSLGALAGGLRLPVPEAIPLDTIPGRFAASRRATADAFEAAAALPDAGRPVEEELRARSGGLVSVLVPALVVVGFYAWLFHRVGYLSVSSFPPGARVVFVRGPDRETGAREELGTAPVTFRRMAPGRGFVVVVWSGNPPRAVDVPGVIEARSHLQVDVGTRGTPAVAIQAPPVVGWATKLFAALAALLPSGSGPAPGPTGAAGAPSPAPGPTTDLRVEEKLAARDVAGAVELLGAEVARDPEAARRAAIRLVEAALARREAAPREAKALADAALGFDEQYPFAHAVLGDVCYALGEGDAAGHLRKAAERLVPGEPPGLPADPAKALAEVRKRLAAAPKDPLLLRFEAQQLLRLGRTREGTDYLRRLARAQGWTTRAR